MDLSTMQTRLRERLGNPDVTDVSAATLTLRLNEALVDIQDNYNFHATKTTNSSLVTVAGTRNYTLPTGTDIVIGVRDTTNGKKLAKMDRIEYDELAKDASVSNAQPTSYFRFGSVIYLDPPPDGVYTLRVRARVATTDLAAAGDTPGIPTSWHIGIVHLARAKHWEVIGDMAKYNTAMQIFNDWVQTKTDEIAEELKADMEQSVKVPALANFPGTSRLDFDHDD